jgi:hypothetical protein
MSMVNLTPEYRPYPGQVEFTAIESIAKKWDTAPVAERCAVIEAFVCGVLCAVAAESAARRGGQGVSAAVVDRFAFGSACGVND